MSEVKTYITSLFSAKGLEISSNRLSIFDDFVETQESNDAVRNIIETQNKLMDRWKIKNRIADIISQQLIIPNGTIGKPYIAKIDFEKLKLTDLIYENFEGLDELGLTFNKFNDNIEGIPKISGDLKFSLLFKINGEDEGAPLNRKVIQLIINPDPKSLWKEIPSDVNDKFWKEDDVSINDEIGYKRIVVSSKRGRSHENVGSFRDDDFAFKYFTKTGWSVVAVSDGAGGYSLSRVGSQIACNAVIDFFEQHSDIEKAKEFEEKIKIFSKNNDPVLLKDIELLAKQNLYKATVFVHNKIKAVAEETFITNPELFNNPKAKSLLDYYHSTFIFALFKKYDFGYVVLTFGVGDCPIAIMNKDQTETTLLNWLDVGEFGGGTRFITQPEIFHSTEHPMATRFNFKIVPDFSYLFLMTDGIYDPKFVVEANLEKSEKWIEFMEDLKGKNEDNVVVEFNPENTQIADQLSKWMDFWSQGNHDDRTLAIVY
jgi:serine/threonine protein phosphatase PrpC